MKPGVEFTAELAKYHKIDPQGSDESESAFKHRVSGALREMGHLIEAHEAFHNQRYDEEGGGALNPMVGLLGAAALASAGRDFGGSGTSRIGDEMMAGVIAKEPRRSDDSAAMMMLAIAMMGSDRR